MKYSGSCHCGAVKYDVEMDPEQLITCNCSICLKKGIRMAFAASDQFNLIQGQDHLSDYQFGKHSIHHLFCKTCGIGSFSKGKQPGGPEMVCINVNCLENADFSKLPVMEYDGASI